MESGESLAQGLRRHQYERYLLTLFAPAARRPASVAILAFDLELTRVPRMVSQPVLGQMRFAWWRDAVEQACGGGDTGGNPVLEALASAARSSVVRSECLIGLIDARERDLLRDPEAPTAEWESDAGEIGAALGRLRLAALGLEPMGYAAACRHHAIALAMIDRLRFPGLGGPADQGALSTAAARHLQAARAGAPFPRAAFPVLGDGVIAARALRRLRRAGGDPSVLRIAAPDGLAPWALTWAWLTRRI
jgi:hypothetical protein